MKQVFFVGKTFVFRKLQRKIFQTKEFLNINLAKCGCGKSIGKS